MTGDNLSKHEDSYFYSVQTWYDQLDLGTEPPRDKRVIYNSFIQSFANPAFYVLKDNKEYRDICNIVAKKGEML